MLYVKMIFYPIAGIFRVVIQCKMSLLVSQFSKCFPLNLHTRHTVIINPRGFIYCNVSTVMLNGSHCVTLNHVVLGVCFFVLRKGKLIFHLIMYLAADTSVLYLFYWRRQMNQHLGLRVSVSQTAPRWTTTHQFNSNYIHYFHATHWQGGS